MCPGPTLRAHDAGAVFRDRWECSFIGTVLIALAAALWVAGTMAGSWYLYEMSTGMAPKPGQPLVQIFPALGDLFLRSPGNVPVYGYLPVVPMVLGSAFLMGVVSLVTKAPSRVTLEKYFPAKAEG